MMKKLDRKFKEINKCTMFIVGIMIVSALFLVGLTTQKESMHVDEYLTYGLANHEWDGNNKINPEYGVKMPATDVFDPFFYPDNFSIKNVWLNQGHNVHPPLYYLCFHIFILATHHFLALKTGILLNIIFHMINIWLVWQIMRKLLSVEYEAVIGAVMYAFTPIILGNVLFIRMYVLMSAFILGLTLLFVREWDKSDRKTFYIKLGLLSVGGALTHYYFLIYLFFCCLVWGIFILLQRKWKELVFFIGTMTAAGGASIAIYPYMIKHLFQGSAGERSFNNLSSLVTLKKNIPPFLKAINNVYGGFLLAVIFFAVIAFVFKYLSDGRIENKRISIGRWSVILIPCVFYFIAVTWIALMTATRYISPIYPVCIILLMGLYDRVVSYLTERDSVKWIVGALMVGILLNNAYKTYDWSELHLEAEECINTARSLGVNNECIYVLNLSWHSFPGYQEFIQYQNMTFIRDNNLDLLYTEDYVDYDHVVMYFDKNVGEEKIEEILDTMIERNPGLDTYERLHEYSYNVAYYLE
ncbi:MAG: glycosyltransferase family 39 protein [Blautia sp.]|nr:glycosyltransferase family 39 protein [Lachnoclostridium sp.]MCM1212203.1 glycosyltransferase family 39 protein [Blautia sp.]